MSLTELDRAIRMERSTIFPQFFTERPIEAATLAAILENANWAPSHQQTEPWRFVIFQGDGRQQLFEQFEAAYRSKVPTEQQDDKKVAKIQARMQQTHTIVGIVLHRDPQQRVPEWEEIAAVAMAVQNFWLSLAQHGLGGFWSSPSVMTDSYAAFPWLAANERCLGLFYLGYHEAPSLPRRRGDWMAKTKWIP